LFSKSTQRVSKKNDFDDDERSFRDEFELNDEAHFKVDFRAFEIANLSINDRSDERRHQQDFEHHVSFCLDRRTFRSFARLDVVKSCVKVESNNL
jgi:hypothetical protein